MCSKKYEIPNPKNAVDSSFYKNSNINQNPFQLDLPMHLTNYSIDDEYDFETDHGKIRTLESLLDYFQEQKHDKKKLWQEIQVKEIFKK